MLGRIVKFRRGDKYEDLEGSDDVPQDAGGGRSSETTPSGGHSGSGVLFHRKTDSGAQAAAASAASAVSEPSKETAEDTFTVDHAVDMIGFGWFQLKLSLFTGLVWMADAMEMMILSILGPALHCDWNLPPWQQALLTSVVFGGMMLSSGFWGKISDKYGRRVEMILCSLFTFCYGLLSAFSPNFIWLLILRGLVGFGVGGVPQSITLYAEFLPAATRGKCVVMIELFWAVGTCFIVLIAIFVMPTLGWRYLFGIASLPLLIFFFACFWLPESPRFDIARGQTDRALETLQRIAADNNKAMPLGRLLDIHHESDEPVARGQIRDLFTPELRLTTGLLWFIWLANTFSYYGVVLMTTELFEVGDTCHGGTAEQNGNLEEPPCRLECKSLSMADYTDLLLTTAAEFPGLFITFLIIEWLGRRKTIAVEFLIFALFVYLVNICVTRKVLIFFLFVARAFISGGFQATYVYTPEVYPTTTRAIGLGMCSGMSRIGALITPFVAQVMLRESVYLGINTYATVSLIAAGFTLLLPIETKGREMKDAGVAKSQSSQSID